MLTRKIGPRNFLAGLCISWGAVMIGMGFTNSWSALAACRVILGLFEAGFFPVCRRDLRINPSPDSLLTSIGLRLPAVDVVRPL